MSCQSSHPQQTHLNLYMCDRTDCIMSMTRHNMAWHMYMRTQTHFTQNHHVYSNPQRHMLQMKHAQAIYVHTYTLFLLWTIISSIFHAKIWCPSYMTQWRGMFVLMGFIYNMGRTGVPKSVPNSTESDCMICILVQSQTISCLVSFTDHSSWRHLCH